MGQKKTRKLLKSILTNENKRAMYSQAELLYLEKSYDLMALQHQRKKMNKKGFENAIQNHE